MNERERLAAIQEEIEAILNERASAWVAAGQQLAPILGKEGDPEQIARLEADDERAWEQIARLEAERQAILARRASGEVAAPERTRPPARPGPPGGAGGD